MAKRYLLFTYDHYYPNGAWGDFRDDFDTVEGAAQAAIKFSDDFYDIVDLETLDVVDGDLISNLKKILG